jgi:hypothetical protein
MIYTEDTPNELLQDVLNDLKKDGDYITHYTYIIALVRQQSHLLPTEKQQQFCNDFLDRIINQKKIYYKDILTLTSLLSQIENYKFKNNIKY